MTMKRVGPGTEFPARGHARNPEWSGIRKAEPARNVPGLTQPADFTKPGRQVIRQSARVVGGAGVDRHAAAPGRVGIIAPR